MTTNNSSTGPIVFGCLGFLERDKIDTDTYARTISMARTDGRLVIFRCHLNEKK